MQVDLIAEGLLKLPFVVGIEIDDQETTKLYGQLGDISRQYDLVHQEEENISYSIGKMTIYSSSSVVFNRVKNGYLLTIVNAIIKTIALWILVLLVGRKLITKPLAGLTKANTSIDLENRETFKEINIEARQTDNEITLLQESFNKMIRRLASDREALERSHQNLESEVALRTQELQEANARLIELGEFKTNMTNMIVHDLKNQLAVVLSQAESPSSRRAAEHMLHMVMNMLDVQKFEDTEIHLAAIDCTLFEIAELAIQNTLFLSEQQNIAITNEIPLRVIVKIDPEIIKRVFINLLNNAVKFTPANGKIKLIAIGEAEDFVRIGVSNTGEGIPANQLERIFDKFVQIKTKRLAGTASTGLGLTFCKLAVEAHGGRIYAESEPGDWTTFWFTLPGLEKTIPTMAPVTSFVSSNQIDLVLSDDDKALLEPHANKLNNVLVYETSKVRSILNEINPENSITIERWKQEIEDTLYTMKEEKYKILLELIR